MPFSPPADVRLINAKPRELIFTWVPPSQYCPLLTYYIIAEDCGTCQNKSALMNTTCSNFTPSSVCTLSVHSVICGNLVSTNPSNVVTVNLKGLYCYIVQLYMYSVQQYFVLYIYTVPEILSVIENIPYYSDSDNNLLRVITTFNTMVWNIMNSQG